MTLKEIRDNALRMLWLENPSTAPDYIFEDVTTAINAAFQLLWQTPKDYFRKQEITVTVPDAGHVVLDNSIQEVIGPVWVAAENDREVHRILDQSDWNQLYQRYFGKSTEGEAITAGVARVSYYFLRERAQVGEDNVNLRLDVKPPPASGATVSVTLLASTQPQVKTVAEIQTLDGTETVGMPHKYVETILLPVVRMMATRSHFFWEKDKLPLIQQDAAQALAMLGLSDPEMGTNSAFAERAMAPTTGSE